MNKIVLLAIANIRKTKGHTITILIMFLISSILLNTGLLVSLNFSNHLDKVAEELKAPDVYYIIPAHLNNEEVDTYITNDENVDNLLKVDTYWTYAETEYDQQMREQAFLFYDADVIRNMAEWKFVGEHLPADKRSIYLPYLFQIEGGYELNDEIEFVFKNLRETFTIKGFTEDVLFSVKETGLMGVYLPHETYEDLIMKLPDSGKARIYFADLKKINTELETGLRDRLQVENISYGTDITKSMLSLDVSLIKLTRTVMPSMVSVMIVAFSTIILLVCLIVVRFRINNSIDEDMIKIGSLKAVGYTSRQIIGSILMQFGLISIIGSLIGIVISYLAIPVLSNVFAQQSGLKWIQSFDISISTFALFAILFIVGVVTLVSSRRIKKLQPIIALRGGIITHNFRKNYISLDKSEGSLSWLFALKTIFQNKKQNIMITIILVAVSFAQAFSVGMYYNSNIDTKAFLETPGVELSNVIFILNPETEQSSLIENLKIQREVRKVQYIDDISLKVDDYQVNSNVMDDYSMKETRTLYEGRYPKHDNEAGLSGLLADKLGKKIGDNVVLKVGDLEAEFLVTGLTQGANMGGMNVSITHDAALKLNPNFKQQSLNIYLNKGENAEEFISKIHNLFGDVFLYTVNVDKDMEVGADVYTAIISKVGISILVITVAIVVLVLYFVINSTIVRKKRELGIQKAIGFTTFQLMNQLSLSLLPSIILGVCIGTILGITQTNPIMTIIQSGMGIKKANFVITPELMVLFGLGIVIFSYFISLLITCRIRRISAIALISE